MNHSMESPRKLMIQSEESGMSLLTDSEIRVLIEIEHNIVLVYATDVPGSPGILSDREHATIIKEACINEYQLIVCFTPTLESLSQECSMIFVNTEDNPWIHTLFETSVDFQKPGGLSTPRNLYIDCGADPRSSLTSLKERYPTTYRYGRGIWKIRDFYVIWDFKVKISPADRGRAYRYLLHLCREDRFNLYQCILCDQNDFIIIKARHGTITSVVSWRWTQSGSRQALLDTLSHRI